MTLELYHPAPVKLEDLKPSVLSVSLYNIWAAESVWLFDWEME